MHIESKFGGLVIGPIDGVVIPTDVVRYPNRRLSAALRKARYRPDQISHTQELMREEESVVVVINADIIVPSQTGLKLRDYIFQGDGEDNLERAKEIVRQSVRRVAGEGRFRHTRRVFDALSLGQPKVGIIQGKGREFNSQWSLFDSENQFFSTVPALIDEIESSVNPRYGILVADFNNPSGLQKGLTQDASLFYVGGDPTARDEVNRQYAQPLRR